MSRKVEIDIFRIGGSTIDYTETKKWLRRVGVSEDWRFPPSSIADEEVLIGLCGKRCYNSFEVGLNPNVHKIREDWTEYLDNILKSGHGSVLEHAVHTFAIEGVSRVFTAEMNRHRAGWAISEASMRYIRFGEDIAYWEPESIRGKDTVDPKLIEEFVNNYRPGTYPFFIQDLTEEDKKHLTREIVGRAFDQMWDNYRMLEAVWEKELSPESKFAGKKAITSMMRRVVGMGCATGGIWTGNVRAVRHVIGMRAAPEAEEEILHVFSRVAAMMVVKSPSLFGDFEKVDGYWRPKYKKV